MAMTHPSENYHSRARLEPQYTNYVEVGHNAFEFLLDFGRSSPEEEEANFHTRIIASPSCAKALFELLRDSIEQYEKSFGLI